MFVGHIDARNSNSTKTLKNLNARGAGVVPAWRSYGEDVFRDPQGA
jgi:hypothetical protein